MSNSLLPLSAVKELEIGASAYVSDVDGGAMVNSAKKLVWQRVDALEAVMRYGVEFSRTGFTVSMFNGYALVLRTK